ncbi:MAG: MgtC/SapB family protein [Candidatus Diapherotrites archaeon]|nr:MgtC/SapB family protein [Candidatus Diapherotrites archaeon]
MDFLIGLEFTQKIVLATLIGALMGLEREHSKHQEIAGLRTFSLISLLGCVLGILAGPELMSADYLPVLGFLAIGLLALALYIGNLFKFQEIGLTTTISLLLAYAMGALVSINCYAEAVFIAVIVVLILFAREKLHRVVRHLTQKEMLDLIEFMVVIGIVYPFIPLAPINFAGISLDLRSLWLLVVLISIINLVGFIGSRLLTARKCVELIGFLGGLISQKASCSPLIQIYKKTKDINLVGGSLITLNASILLRNLALVGVFMPVLIVKLSPAAFLGFFALALLGYRRLRSSKKTVLKIKSPFDVMHAIGLSIKLFLMIIIIELFTHYFPDAFIPTIILGGLVSGASTVASLAILGSTKAITADMVVVGFAAASLSELLFGAIPLMWFYKALEIIKDSFLDMLAGATVFSIALYASLLVL